MYRFQIKGCYAKVDQRSQTKQYKNENKNETQHRRL